MKKFIFSFFIFLLLFFLFNLSFRTLYFKTLPSRLAKNILDKDIRTVVIGPSNGEFAWNDTIIKHSKNLCSPAKSLHGCYSSLKWVEEYNEAEIDTIILCASFLGFIYFDDKDLNLFVEGEYCLFEHDAIFNFFKYRLSCWRYLTSSLNNLSFFDEIIPSGEFRYSHRNKISDPHRFDQINEKIIKAGGDNNFTESYIRENCKYQLHYLSKIKDYCTQHGKTLVILSTPIYKIPDMVSYDGYHQLMRKELGDSALIADYTRFEFPDSTYYADLEHLNFRGAEYFSKHIAKNGLELRYAIDCCK